jgi:hypothetical protein
MALGKNDPYAFKSPALGALTALICGDSKKDRCGGGAGGDTNSPSIITAEPIRSFGWFISFVGNDFKYSNTIGQDAPDASGADGISINDALPAREINFNINREGTAYRMPWGDVGVYSAPLVNRELNTTFYDIANFNGLYYKLIEYLNKGKPVKTIKVKKLLPNNTFYEGIVFHNCRPTTVRHENMNHSQNEAMIITADFNWEYATVYSQAESGDFRSDN